MKKKIAIFGSTGSIGTQALEVIEYLQKDFAVVGLSTHDRENIFNAQLAKFKPPVVLITNPAIERNIKIFAGSKIIIGDDYSSFIEYAKPDLVINAISGFAGLRPTLAVIKSKVDLALANKESLVLAGESVMTLAQVSGVKIFPLDSEHQAIWQLTQNKKQDIKRIILTCSGGPFFGKNKKELQGITPEKACCHPKWKMGRKISIDSATLMNKGFEVIEASHLFGLGSKQIEVVVHPESLVHSFVEYIDNSIEGLMATPDMRLPIQSILTYPECKTSLVASLDLVKQGRLSFFAPDTATFPCLSYAYEALHRGGSLPTILNLANDRAVDLFLRRQLKFLEIPKFIRREMDKHKIISKPKPEEILTLIDNY